MSRNGRASSVSQLCPTPLYSTNTGSLLTEGNAVSTGTYLFICATSLSSKQAGVWLVAQIYCLTVQ